MTDDLVPQGGVRASDAEREAAVTRLQTAMAEGRITVEEFSERAQAAYAATTVDQLGPLFADLPARAAAAQVEIVGNRPPAARSSLLGDVRLDGRLPLPQRTRTGIGDIRVDLRALRTDAEVVELDLSTVIGDVDVVVAEGVDAQLDGWTVIGDRRVELAPVPRLAGTPRVVVRAHAFIGDLRLRSLGPGESVRGWRALLDRLAERPRPSGS